VISGYDASWVTHYWQKFCQQGLSTDLLHGL